MSSSNTSIKDFLYEPPGPKARKWINFITAVSFLAIVALIYIVIRQFYITGQLNSRYWSFFSKYTTWKFIGKGLASTVGIALTASVISFLTGLVMMLCRISKSKALNRIGAVLVELSRGIPTLLFIYFFFLVVPQLGIKLAAFWKITLPVAISAAGIVGEVLRSGVHAVPKGQTEAALSLGMKDSHVFFKIVFPQALRYEVPALISELIIVLKDTTFAYVVSYSDLMQNSRILISNYDALLSVYLVVTIIYILINYVLNKISVFAARKLDV